MRFALRTRTAAPHLSGRASVQLTRAHAAFIPAQKHPSPPSFQTEYNGTLSASSFLRHAFTNSAQTFLPLPSQTTREIRAYASSANPSHSQTSPQNTALLVIDMQNDFILPNSPLCVNGGLACIPKVVQAVDHARKAHIPVIWIIREHDPSGIDVEFFRQKLYTEPNAPKPVTPGSFGAKLVEPLKPTSNELVIIKKRFSAFFNTNLDSVLRRINVDHVVLAGVQVPNCIRGTATDAISLDYKHVTVLSDGTGSATAEIQQSNLRDLRNVGVEVLTVDDWCRNLVV